MVSMKLLKNAHRKLSGPVGAGNIRFSALIVLVTTCIAVGLLFYGVSLIKQIEQTQQSWDEFSSQASSRLQILSHINKHLGYGGFIHNFKNYVMRKDFSREPLIEQNLIEITKAVKKYERLDLNEDEHKAITVFKQSLSLYHDRFELAKQLMQGDLPARIIDQLVVISDIDAIIAMDVLNIQVDTRLHKSQDAAHDSLRRSVLLVTSGSLLLPIIFAGGGVILYILLRLERLRREQQEANLMKAMTQNMSEAVVMANAKGEIIKANPAACEMFGYTEDDFCKLKIEALMPIECIKDYETLWRSMLETKAGRTAGRDLTAVTYSGVVLDVIVSLGSIDQKGQVMSVVVVRDITERKKKEDSLRLQKDQLEMISLQDSLTGIGNRRYFDMAYAKEWNRSLRHGRSLVVLMLDVDHFKLYNDHYGHLAGDDCLKQVAQTIGSCVRRSGDMVARYGGEEFVCILTDIDGFKAMRLAQHICRSVESISVPHEGSSYGVVTVSCGVAAIDTGIHTKPEHLIKAADQALYQAKESGRNQAILNRERW